MEGKAQTRMNSHCFSSDIYPPEFVPAEEDDRVELSLSLSLNGQFGIDPTRATKIIGDECRKRKQMQSLRRMAAKRKRTEKRMNMKMEDHNVLLEMPSVCTKGGRRRIEGFLYRYRKEEEVKIVCVCHGSFLSPAEFVEHEGGGDGGGGMSNPLKHIVVNPFRFL